MNLPPILHLLSNLLNDLRSGAALRDERGAVSVEYVTIVGTIGLLLVGSLVSLGPYMVINYQVSRSLLIGPFP